MGAIKLLRAVLLCSMTSVVLASEQSLFPYASSDLSLTYLNFLFGPLSGIGLYLQHNALSFAIVKILVFSMALASFLGGWAVFLGTFRSSTEGKFLGEKLSQTSVIVRSVLALGLLSPDQTGYAPIQRMFMAFILMGVSLANGLWELFIDRYEKGDSLLSSSSDGTATSKTLSDKLLGYSMLLNYLTTIGEIVDFEVTLDTTKRNVQIQVLPNKSTSNTYSAPLIIYQSNGSELDPEMLVGLDQCLRSFAFDVLATVAAAKMTTLIITDAAAMTSEQMTTAYNNADIDADLRQALVTNSRAKFYSLMAKQSNQASSDINQYRNQGWMAAGSIYWMLSQSFTPQNYSDALRPANPATGVPAGSYVNVDDWLNAISGTFYDPAKIGSFGYQLSVTNATNTYSSYGNTTNTYSTPVTSALDASLAGVTFTFDSLNDPFSKALSGSDPFLDFIMECQNILRGLLIFMITSLVVMVTLTLVTAFYKNTVPVAHTILVVMSMILFLILSFSFIVIPGAAFGGYYLPLVPMLIFTATAISWLLKVVEAIVAAPFVAVALLEPTQDDFGRGTSSVLLLLHVAAKPALIMIGFFLASRVMILALSLYAIPLSAFLGSNIFPATSSKIAYQKMMTMVLVTDTTVAVIVALATRAFALIYKIPDRVFGWIGHYGSGSDVSSIIGEVRSGAEQGIKMMSKIFEVSVAAGKSVVEASNMKKGS